MRFLKSNLREQFFGTFLRTELGILFFFIVQIFKNLDKDSRKLFEKFSRK